MARQLTPPAMSSNPDLSLYHLHHGPGLQIENTCLLRDISVCRNTGMAISGAERTRLR